MKISVQQYIAVNYKQFSLAITGSDIRITKSTDELQLLAGFSAYNNFRILAVVICYLVCKMVV